jgi:hypothetical protein
MKFIAATFDASGQGHMINYGMPAIIAIAQHGTIFIKKKFSHSHYMFLSKYAMGI